MNVSAQTAAVPVVREFGALAYRPVWRRMARFAAEATPETREELWLLSHHPVFTLGQAGKREHLLAAGGIPVIETDRGGQVTYHGPGQLVAYPLWNLRRRGMGARDLVGLLESAVIDTLAGFGIDAATRPGAPGVFAGEAKIAALGLRIKRGWSYHGLSLNVDMDLAPFQRINPCGCRGLQVARIADFTGPRPELMRSAADALQSKLLRRLLDRFPIRAEINPLATGGRIKELAHG